MWAYRIDKPYFGPTHVLNDVRRELGVNDEIALDNALRHTLELCRHVGWDGTYSSQVRVWGVPGLHRMSLGFIFKDLTGRTFIVSPISLPHLSRGLDWDAMVSHEEIAATKRAVLTGDLGDRMATLTQGWQTSRKGNVFAKINGAAVTVFATDNGYKAILNPIGRSPITTLTFSSQAECCKYVLNNWYDLINPPEPVDEDTLDW